MTDVFNINYSNIFGGEKATRPNRMLRAARKQESLALPDNYREIPEEEMYYEGGGNAWYNSVNFISTAIDVGVALLTCGVSAIAGTKWAGRWISKRVARVAKAIAVSTGIGVRILEGIFNNFDYILSWLSVGGIVANSLDIADGKRDGYINF